MEFIFNNRAKVSTRKKTDEGYLDVSAVIYRSGLFEFSSSDPAFGDQLPQELRSKQKIVLNVPDEAVRDEGFLNSAGASPVTDGHPSEFVNAKTARYLQRGTVKGPAKTEPGGDVLLVNSDIRIVDGDLVNSVESGEREEVSIGNSGVINWEPGKRSGQDFDGVLTPKIINHVAVVKRGRGGRDVRLLNKTGDDMEFVTMIVNGVETQVAKSNEVTVTTLLAQVKNGETELATARATVSNLETQLAEKDTQLKNAEGVVTDEEITRLVNEKSETVDLARKVMKEVDASASTREIKVSAINSVDAELINAKSSDAVIDAVFATLTKVKRTDDAGARDIQNAINNGVAPKADDEVAEARKARSERRKKGFAMNFAR